MKTKFKYLLVAFFFTLVSGCDRAAKNQGSKSSDGLRSTASIDLYQVSESINKELDDTTRFNLETCPQYLETIYQTGLNLDPNTLNLDKTKEDWHKIYQNLWGLRQKLKTKLEEMMKEQKLNADHKLVKACANSMRHSIRLARYIEDYLAEYFGGEPQDIDQPEGFKPVIPTPFEKEFPWTVKSPLVETIKIKSGDLIISRGNAYTSAAISRIVEVDSQFSHLAMIYVPSGHEKEFTVAEAVKSKDVLVLEAHIEVGSTIRPFSDYAADGNARNLLFRYRGDAKLAHAAAKSTYEFLENYRERAYKKAIFQRLLAGRDRDDVNFAVPYDFKMDLAKSNEVFCSEVGYYGYKTQKVTIPTFRSDINPGLDLVKRLSISGNWIFAPGDMELEPQFEMLAEFRNLRRLKGVRMKDMALSSFLSWMDKEKYLIVPTASSSTQSLRAWFVRQLDLNLQNVRKRMPKNMNVNALNTVFTLNNVAEYLEKHLMKEEIEYKKKNRGLMITYPDGIESLEKLRVQDKADYLAGKKAPIHKEFRPPGVTSNNQETARN